MITSIIEIIISIIESDKCYKLLTYSHVVIVSVPIRTLMEIVIASFQRPFPHLSEKIWAAKITR